MQKDWIFGKCANPHEILLPPIAPWQRLDDAPAPAECGDRGSMMETVVDRLRSDIAQRRQIVDPVVVLAAHPDDETLALSVALPLFSNLTMIHATVSAQAAETSMRRAELEESMLRLGCAPRRCLTLELPDGELTAHVAEAAEMLARHLEGVTVCITHAFEGGHWDHDACAFAVSLAAGMLGTEAPALAEFPVYSIDHGRILPTRFADGRGTIRLSEAEALRKRHALNAFTSQRHVVDRFPLDVEAIAHTPVHPFLEERPAADVLFAQRDQEAARAWRAVATTQSTEFTRRFGIDSTALPITPLGQIT